jgi:DNA-binding MarR family transcriptional regulator
MPHLLMWHVLFLRPSLPLAPTPRRSIKDLLDRISFSCENSETEFSTMPHTDIKQHEYDLLTEIGQDPMVTQANLSKRLGIAVGSVNWYVKRLIHRGWIKVSHLDRTRLKYDLTPDGMAVFTQRALLYAQDSLKVYSNYRKKAKALVAELQQKGITQVYLDGKGEDETLDILRLTCIEAGLQLGERPKGIVIKVDGRDYQMSIKE